MIACGTSALRDAANSREFIQFIRTKIGIDITILTGDEEADLTYLGGVSEFIGSNRSQQFVVLDIGGGSTEVVVGKSSNVESKVSLDIGSVRLTERFLKTSPPLPSGLKEAQEYIRVQVRALADLANRTRCIGVAWTLTTLAAIDLQLQTYDRNRVSGHVLALAVIESIFDRLKGKRLEELKVIPQILPQRADIILAGIMILLEVMKKIGVEQITASDRGLRYGILMKAAREYNNRSER
jgi:exopolyphosphatase / guanosine-5'-triphosphate,3'-diphosphate pyrophosphatase